MQRSACQAGKYFIPSNKIKCQQFEAKLLGETDNLKNVKLEWQNSRDN
jgi:hypothetical protein